ncbi:polysaccharide deacetylase family protein [Arsenicitalea aurantiaca]|uniref:Chitooligosaccharide deacetylase n=1 Tax=Arsenicitalea aurantiaca TaxID=1783274 RepID=A0A433XGF2_9HYPH|nr:polysaccharide deacetylase family protein [Arsenicitalea aurantiaca]RUT33028.1 polysaccharide deacetylase family protein [Arsenicitalea aurantiaca]
MVLAHGLLVGLVVLAMAGCAKPPREQAFEPYPRFTQTVSEAQAPRFAQPSALAGRTLKIASNADIRLAPGEVVLTFDDGPRPDRTEAILDTLDRHGVKASFLMVGHQALNHPQIVQEVARRGHSVGHHTFTHRNLADASPAEAEREIAAGEAAVAHALAGSGLSAAPFFRFPYLAQTSLLRAGLGEQGMVILDVDVDSKDYYPESPGVVTKRTLDRLEERGRGIILFHDVHQRTVDMMDGFLAELTARGYRVVHLVPGQPDPELVVAGR